MQRRSVVNDSAAIAGTLAMSVHEAWRMGVRNMVRQSFNVSENTAVGEGPSPMLFNMCGHEINLGGCAI